MPSDSAGVGRVRVVYFQHNNKALVLKHYCRGGLVTRFNKDRYPGVRVEKTRAFREWRLLKNMHSLGLPVPVAVAAHARKSLFYFRADLITIKIEHSKTLADVLAMQVLDSENWYAIGACIKQFHQHNIYHADLNARNIMITEPGSASMAVYLIDFDNSDFRLDAVSWKMANLARLKRSLAKFSHSFDDFHFVEKNWSDLLAGYAA